MVLELLLQRLLLFVGLGYFDLLVESCGPKMRFGSSRFKYLTF